MSSAAATIHHRPQGPARERRRQDLRGRLARATFPLRQALDRVLDGFPCNVPLLGHDWVEIPPSLRSARARAEGRLEFACSRCSTRAGFRS